MPQRLRLAALGSTFAALLLAAGCGPHQIRTVTAPASNMFRVPLVNSPTTFDPAMVEDGTTIDVLQNLFEGLVQWSPENKIVPCLAKSWDVSKDGLTYTFHLRPGVKFQDGNPVTAQDVYYSFHRSLDPAQKSEPAPIYMSDIVGAAELNKGQTKDLKGVKVIDPMTVAITITKPKAYWIYTLTYPTDYIISKAEGDKTPGVQMSAETIALGAGTGPFRLQAYAPDSKVTMTANTAYWDGAPKVAGIERPIITSADTRHAAYVHGDLDLLQYLQPGNLVSDQKDPSLKAQIQSFPRASTFYIGLNQTAFPAFKDPRVRQALAYATDKKLIVQRVFQGQRDVAQDILPEGIPGGDPKFQGLPYDPAKAQALLAAAGYPGGKGFPVVPMIYRNGYPELAATVALIGNMWQTNLGIKVQGAPEEYGKMLSEKDAGTLQCYHIRWAADYLDPQDYYTVLLHTKSPIYPENTTGYSNPQYDALCDAADVGRDQSQRFALYRKAARIAADDVPLIPLYYQKDPELIKPYVHNIDDCLMGHLPYKHITLH
jgi:oligopeptide transport system substrate-binding protein